MYVLRKGDLFVLSWARVRRLWLGSISSELILCGEGVDRVRYCVDATLWNASFKLTLFGCVNFICCVCFASLDVVCDELNDSAWNVCL